MKREPLYAKESDLCADFITWAKGHGWTAYAETDGWDIVLVRNGRQIGVQAKLRFNAKVIAQCLPQFHYTDGNGPDYRAVLVGSMCEGLPAVCEALGIAVFYPRATSRWCADRTRNAGFGGDAEIVDTGKAGARFYKQGLVWFDWNPAKQIQLPAYVPDVVAGASGPLQLTPWKIGALRLVALLELRGFITRKDFQDQRINPTRWTQFWLRAGATRGEWVRGEGLPDFDQQHPINYQQIKAEVAKTLAQEPARA